MPGPRFYLTVFLASLILTAGCLNPAGSPAGAATTLPTNEPTPLPTQAPGSLPMPVVSTSLPYETIPVTQSIPLVTPPTYVTPYQNTVYQPNGQNGYTPGQATGSESSSQAIPEPSNPADIVFKHYSDQNFGVDYPSDWTVTQTGYVKFTSASGRVTFTAVVNDFISGLAGNYRLNPDISAIQDIVSREFPRYAAGDVISNYENAMVNGVPATEYSVTLPDGSVSYTRYILVTLHHTYQFTFAADTATFNQVVPLRNYLFSTFTVSDQQA